MKIFIMVGVLVLALYSVSRCEPVVVVVPGGETEACAAAEIIRPWQHEVVGLATDGVLLTGPAFLTRISHSWGDCTFELWDGETRIYQHWSALMEKDQHPPLLCPMQIYGDLVYKVRGLCSVVVEYARP